jgi:hypothetical protein
MSGDASVPDVFEAVEAEPDAILEACDAETPAELVESGGKHDPVPDGDGGTLPASSGAGDATDVTAAELFADLASVADDVSATDATPAAEVIAGRPTVTVRSDDELAAAESAGGTAPDSSADGLEFAGGEPTTTRVPDDAFGSAGSEDRLEDLRRFATPDVGVDPEDVRRE